MTFIKGISKVDTLKHGLSPYSKCNFSNATSPMQLLQFNSGGRFFISEVCHDCKGRFQMIDRLSVKNVLCKNDEAKNLI